MFKRHSRLLDADHRLAVLIFFGATAAAGILPFAIWRAFQGQWLAVLLEIIIVAGFSGAIAYAWRSGRINLVARSIALFVTIGLVAVTPAIGKLALLWAGPIILANLMLAGRKLGFVINLFLILGLLLLHKTPLTSLEQAAFACTGLLISLYGYVFALTADQQRDKLEKLASYDDLTGVGNRRMMEHDLRDAFANSRRHKAPCAIAVIDIDHFKIVNDIHGHGVGDDVLRRLARLTLEALRSKDRLYRMGGEEFVVLLPETDKAGLAQALERLQAHLRPRLDSPAGPVTLSMGGAVLQAGDSGWAEWLDRADQALYAAKAAGRDQVQMAPTTGPIFPGVPRRRSEDQQETHDTDATSAGALRASAARQY